MKIGITGGIATGKSTASTYFENKGYPVIDADKIAKEIVEPNEPTLHIIQQTFGDHVIHEDGSLNREALGNIVFTDTEAREKLNAIMHPAIRKAMVSRAATLEESGHSVVFLDIPLLFENNLTSLVDVTLLVYVPADIQLKRLMERNGYTVEEAQSRINSQLPIEDKRGLANHVVNNSGSVSELYHLLDAFLASVKK